MHAAGQVPVESLEAGEAWEKGRSKRLRGKSAVIDNASACRKILQKTQGNTPGRYSSRSLEYSDSEEDTHR